MKTSGGLPHRMTARLQNFDYSNGETFFVTICSHEKRCIFGDVESGEVYLNEIGTIADKQWRLTPTIRPGVVLDEYQVMPNHLHATLCVPPSPERANEKSRRAPRSLATTIGGYKAAVTSAVRTYLGNQSFEVWQPRFYEHAIRSDRALERARRYIRENPANWGRDRENPNRVVRKK